MPIIPFDLRMVSLRRKLCKQTALGGDLLMKV
jgi:hypothetical protein